MENNLRSEIRNQINNWNRKFPIDYWWRRKYNIPFGSKLHREANLIQMFYDYEEEKIMNKVLDRISEEIKQEDSFDEPSVGKKMSKRRWMMLLIQLI